MSHSKFELPEDQIATFCRKWKIAEFSLFGSVLSDRFGPESDVDVLVDFGIDTPWGLYDWFDMIDELETIFHRKVDLVSKRGLRNPFRRHNILNSRMVVYAA